MKGSTLVIVLAFLAAFVVLTTTIVQVLRTRSTLTKVHALRAQALGIAETGIQDAIQNMTDNPGWSAGFTGKAFDNGFYTVTIDTSSGTTRVTSEGYIPGGSFIKSTVRVFAWVDVEGVVCAADNGDLKIEDGSYCVGGTVYSQKDMAVDNATVTGNAKALKNITLTGSGIVTGTKNSMNFPPIPSPVTMPVLKTEADYQAEATAGGTYSGDYTISGGVVNLGPLYITGDLDIKSGATVTLVGTVFVKRDAVIDQSTLSGKHTFYTKEDMDVKKSTIGVGNAGPLMVSKKEMVIDESTVYSAVLYAYNDDLEIKKSTVTGMAIGKSLDVKDHSSVTWVNVTGLNVVLPAGTTPKNWASK